MLTFSDLIETLSVSELVDLLEDALDVDFLEVLGRHQYRLPFTESKRLGLMKFNRHLNRGLIRQILNSSERTLLFEE